MNRIAWLHPLLDRYSLLAVGFSLLWITSWQFLWPDNLAVQVAVLALLVALIGLPHGATDYVIGHQWLAPRLGSYWFICFNAGYLGLAALVVAAWYVSPLPWLSVMLALSAVHFGLDDSYPRLNSGLPYLVETISRGSMVIVLPAWLYPAEYQQLVSYLLPAESPQALAAWIADIKTWCLPPLILGLSWVLVSHLVSWYRRAPQWRFHRNVVGEVSVLLLAMAVLPPLLSFVLYFCIWHSLRQILLVSAQLESSSPKASWRNFLKVAWLPTALVIITAGVIWLQIPSVSSVQPKTVSLVMITLLALTLPHMCLRHLTFENLD